MLIILKKTALPWLVLVATLLILGEARGQTPTYLNGQKTGNVFGGSLISLGRGNSGLSVPPMSSHSTANFLNIGSTFRFFYGDASATPVMVSATQDLGVLGVLGAGANAYIQIRNTGNAIIAGGKTTYFSIDKPILSGVSVAVGGALGIIELQNIKGFGYSGTTNYTLNSANTAAGATWNGNEGIVGSPISSTTEMLLDKNTNWYAAVTPISTYNSVRLEVVLPTDLRVADLARSLNVNVYNAFVQADGGPCNLSPQFTSPGELLGGISVNLDIIAGLGLSTIVQDPQKAINGNSTDFSAFSSGFASVGVVNPIAQRLYFDHKATAQDSIRVQLGIQQSLVDLGVLWHDKIKFKFYNGETAVDSINLASVASLLQLNLLNLVTINGTNHKKLDFTFKPGFVFDRFEIVYNQGLVNVGVIGDALRVYEVSLTPSLPNITLQPTNANSTNICEGSAASFTAGATVSSGGVISNYQWQYLDASNVWQNVLSGTTNAPDLSTSSLSIPTVTYAMNNTKYRTKVTGGNSGCPQDTYSNEVQLTVIPKALATHIDAPDVTICQGHSTTLTASCNNSAILNPIFKWYATSNVSGTPLFTGSTYDAGTPTNTISYWVTIEGTATCQTTPSSAKQVTVTVTPNPAAPAIIIN